MEPIALTQAPHPLLSLRALVCEGTLSQPALDLPSPLSPPDDALRGAVRDLLRHGGFKPTGRSKPASEYLARAAAESGLMAISPVVDICNIVSLHSGFPVSVVDLDRATTPLRVEIAGPGARYVFNASGQEIDLEGLLCLFDAEGPCANAVKDSQRTKTGESTRRTLAVLWGVSSHAARVDAAAAWYRELLSRHGGLVEELVPTIG